MAKSKVKTNNTEGSIGDNEPKVEKSKIKDIYDIKKYIEKFLSDENKYIKGMLVSQYSGLIKKKEEWETIIKKETTRRIL